MKDYTTYIKILNKGDNMEFLTDEKFIALASVALLIISETLPAFNVKPNSITEVIKEILGFLIGKKDKE